MSNPVRRHSSAVNEFPQQLSPDEELAIFEKVVLELMSDPQKLREVVVRAGIATPSGKLTKGYRS
ncbi:MAG: hypothetical protein ABW202_08430 [Duganella sp.]